MNVVVARITLRSRDVALASLRGAPSHAPGPGVLLVHDAWGLDAEIETVIGALADAGFTVLAPDLLGGRVAGDPDEAAALAAQLDPEDAARVLAAAVDELAADPSTRPGPMGAVGFGMGAPLAAFAATIRPQVAVVVVAGAPADLPLEAWGRATAGIVVLAEPADEATRAQAEASLDSARAAGVEVALLAPSPGEDLETAAIRLLIDRLAP